MIFLILAQYIMKGGITHAIGQQPIYKSTDYHYLSSDLTSSHYLSGELIFLIFDE